AERVLARFSPHVLVEVNLPLLERAGASPSPLLAHMADRGYRCWSIGPRELRAVDPLMPAGLPPDGMVLFSRSLPAGIRDLVTKAPQRGLQPQRARAETTV